MNKILTINNITTTQLVNKYQTPLIVYDQNLIESNIKSYKKYFKSQLFKTNILYASKAFSCKYMNKIVNQQNIGIDVVSYGELYTAINSQVDPKVIYFHGNNKTEEEIRLGLTYGIKAFVVDNLGEIDDMKRICEELDIKTNILLRMNIGVEAHTHQYIVTSHIDSKFGLFIDGEDTKNSIKRISESKFLNLIGFHSHIGSQIFELDGYYAAIDKLLNLCTQFDYPLSINLGGGFGISYTNKDKPIGIKETCTLIINYIENILKEQNLSINELLIEPGRSIVGEAGYSLYTIGNEKITKNKHYLFIDGGMSDNIRPALYQAEYACDIANRINESKTDNYTIAGKCCESGDILIQQCKLPKAKKNDTLVVYSCGAYGYSMASNYNKLTIPAVVFIKDGIDKLAIRRQSIEQMIERECDV
jgi:diaminopimelate decarboxylase